MPCEHTPPAAGMLASDMTVLARLEYLAVSTSSRFTIPVKALREHKVGTEDFQQFFGPIGPHIDDLLIMGALLQSSDPYLSYRHSGDSAAGEDQVRQLERDSRTGSLTRQQWQTRLTELMLKGELSCDLLQRATFSGVAPLRAAGTSPEDLYAAGFPVGALLAGGFPTGELGQIASNAIQTAYTAVSWDDAKTWQQLSDELDGVHSSFGDLQDVHVAVSALAAMRAQTEEAVTTALSRGRSIPVLSTAHKLPKADETKSPAAVPTSFPLHSGKWSHDGIELRELTLALEQLAAFPRTSQQSKQLQAEARLVLSIRTALQATSWTDPKSWAKLANELDAADPQLRSTLDEVTAAAQELDDVRATLEQSVVDSMNSGRALPFRGGVAWTTVGVAFEPVQSALNHFVISCRRLTDCRGRHQADSALALTFWRLAAYHGGGVELTYICP